MTVAVRPLIALADQKTSHIAGMGNMAQGACDVTIERFINSSLPSELPYADD